MNRIRKYTWIWSFVFVFLFTSFFPNVSHAEADMNAFKVQRTYTSDTFADIQGTEWYAKDVAAAYELGLLSGKGEKQFDPRGNLTLAEAVSIAARIHSLYNGGDGTIAPEVGAPWYAGAVRYALEHDIIWEHLFTDWQKNATRSEVAFLLVRSIGFQTLVGQQINDISYIPDVFPDNRFHGDILNLYRAGVISGADEYGTFNPNASITRAEMAAMLNRFVHLDQRIAFQLKKKPLFTPPREEIAAAYLKVINDLTSKYGIYTDETGYLYEVGLVYANLIDFDGNSVPELYLLYLDHADVPGGYTEEIWEFSNGVANLFYSKSYNISNINNDQTTRLTATDSGSYIIHSGSANRGLELDGQPANWSGDYTIIYSIVDGQWQSIVRADIDAWYPVEFHSDEPLKKEYTIVEKGQERKVTKEQYDRILNRYVNDRTVMLIDGGYGLPRFTVDLSEANQVLKDVMHTLREAATSKDIADEQDVYSSLTLDEKRKLIQFLNHFAFHFPGNFESTDDNLADVLWFAHKKLHSDLWDQYERENEIYIKIKQDPIDRFVERWFGFKPGTLPPAQSEYGEQPRVMQQNGYYYFLDADMGFLSTPSYQVEKMVALGDGRYAIEYTLYELVEIWQLGLDVGLENYWEQPKELWSPLIMQHAMIDGYGQAIVKEAIYDGELVWQLQKSRFNQKPFTTEEWNRWIRP